MKCVLKKRKMLDVIRLKHPPMSEGNGSMERFGVNETAKIQSIKLLIIVKALASNWVNL